jgi:hypothetical protein
MNRELLTYEANMHYQELRHEAEQQRLLAHLPVQRNSVVRHTIALCGVMLVRAGMKLKQAEMYGEPGAI